MGYYLQAIIAQQEHIEAVVPQPSLCISLPQCFALFPLVARITDQYGIDYLPLTDGGYRELPSEISKICSATSSSGKCAYIEAEYFGGEGGQANVLWEKGRIISGPTDSPSAINEALAYLGVIKEPGKDEFDTLGLGTHRDTNNWESV